MNGFSILSDTICYVFFSRGWEEKGTCLMKFLDFLFFLCCCSCMFRGCFYVFVLQFLITQHISASILLPNQYTFPEKINKIFGQKYPFIQCRIIFAQSSRQINIIVFLKDKIKHTYSVSFEYSCNFRYQWIIRIWITK